MESIVEIRGYTVSLGQDALEEIRLENEITARVAKIDEIERAVTELDAAMQEKNEQELKELEKLQSELNALLSGNSGGNSKQEAAQDIEEIIKAAREHNRRLEEQASSGKKAPSARAKELFAKIAQKTHPDKTDDLEKHALFKHACKAKDRNDIEELTAILKALGVNSGRKFAARLVSRLRELQARDAETRATLETLLASEQYRIVQEYKNPSIRRYIESQYNMILKNGIESLKDRIRELDSKRYVKTGRAWSFSEVFRPGGTAA